LKNAFPEFVVCRDRPAVVEVPDGFVVMYCRDCHLTILLAEENKRINKLLGKASSCETEPAARSRPQPARNRKPSEDDESRNVRKWKLPDNETSRIIAYYGRPVKFSRTRFGVMRTLILAGGRHVSYEDVAVAGWGEPTDRQTIEATVYQLNKFLESEGTAEFVSCRDGHLLLTDHENNRGGGLKNRAYPKKLECTLKNFWVILRLP